MAGAKRPAKKKTVKRPAAKASRASKPAKRAAAKKPAAKKATPAPKKPAPREDLGAPVDGFFAKQPPHLKPVTDALRRLVEQAAPDAESAIKWGMPFYTVGGAMMCAIGAHKSHVNLVLAGPPDAFKDPEGRLEGEGATGRHLKLRSLDELPKASVRAWVKTAADLARKRA